MRKNVLLVEDYAIHQIAEVAALEKAGFSVQLVSTQEDAKSWFQRMRRNANGWIVVLDLRLAGEDKSGLHLLHLLDQDPVLKGVPVLVASALVGELKEELRGRAVLSKPFLGRELVEEMQKLAEH